MGGWVDGWIAGRQAGTITGKNKELREKEPGLSRVDGLPRADHLWPARLGTWNTILEL